MPSTDTALRVLTSVLLLSVAACDSGAATPTSSAPGQVTEGSPTRTAAEAPPAATEEAPDDPLERELFRLAGEYAQLLDPHGEMQRGRLEEGQEHDYQVVLHGGRCYKIIGTGIGGVKDLDLVLFDPHSVQVRQDIATDPHPILGLTDPICPDVSGAFRVRAKMSEGQGEFGFRAYGSRL